MAVLVQRKWMGRLSYMLDWTVPARTAPNTVKGEVSRRQLTDGQASMGLMALARFADLGGFEP